MNQKNFGEIHKELCNRNNLYATINLNALQKAMADLGSSPAFHLWVYFAKNQNGYICSFSSADALLWGVPKTSFYSAMNKLKEKKYLVEKEKNSYDFYEIPKEEKIEVTVNKNDDAGFVF